MTLLCLELGYKMKYCLSPLEIPRAPPSGFHSGSGNISSYTHHSTLALDLEAIGAHQGVQ